MKVLFVLEHPRDTYFVKNQFNFPASKVGKQLFQYITSKKYLGLNNDQYRITFAYDKIPEKLPSGKDKNITMRMAKPSIEKMKEKAIEYQPDLIVPMGNLALSAITGTKGISKKRGIPQEVTLEVNDLNFKTWVIPTYTIENTLARNETKPFLISDFQLIKSYTKEGAYAFSKGLGEYSLITDFNKVQEIFNMLKSKGQDYKHPIAMDFETNSTNGSLQNVPNKLSKHAREMYGDLVDQDDYVSAKPIILSLTWEEGQGVAIPVEHKKAPWTKEQVDYIEQEIRNLFEDDRWIVGHNFKFDMRFCMDTIGVTKAVHCMDTLLMFYVSVSEESSIEKGLKPLAFRYTTMGGYDQSLVNEKKKIIDESEQLARDWYSAHDEKFTKSKYEKICNEVLGANVDGGNFNYEWIPLDVMYPYAGGDTDACLRIFNQLLPPIIENKKWLNLITNFYPKLDEALSLMEHNGLKMNLDRAKELYTIYDKELTKLLDDMRENTPEIQELEDTRRGYLKERVQLMAIKPKDRTEEQKARIKELNKYKGTRADPESKVRYNPSSRNDSKYILYDMMGYRLPIEREYLTDTALKRFGRDINPDEVTTDDFKANAEALEYIVDTYHSEFAKRLIYYTKLQTLMNNFIVKLPTLLDPKHYMHTTFVPTGTVTTRLASKLPNLQQLKRRSATPSDFSYENSIKSMFEPRYKGGVLLNIDFSSLEIHIAAMVAKDPSMIQILLDGDDYHSMTARNIWNLPKDEPVPKDVRSKAKAASFGSIYGESAMGLSSKEGIPLKDAEEVLDGLMKAYPLLDKKIQDTQKMAETKKYVEMISGFRRRLDKINSNDKAIQSRTLRQSFNAVVQGSGAYCTNTALIVLRAIFEKLHLKSLMVLTVHDSIVIDVHPDEIDTVYKICTYVFSHLPIPELNNLPIGNLNVPEELKQSPTTYRFPMVGEAEIGLNYNDDVDFDPEEFKDFASLTGYCKYKYSMLKLNEHLGMYDTEKYTKDDKEEQITKYKNAIKKLEDNKSLFEKVR